MANAKPLVIGNWKMNLDFVEAVHLGQQIGVLLKNRPLEHTEIVVAPPFVDLRSVTSIVDSERIPIAVGPTRERARERRPHRRGQCLDAAAPGRHLGPRRALRTASDVRHGRRERRLDVARRRARWTARGPLRR